MNMQDYKDEKYSQTVIFLSLCSQKDQDFIKMPRSALTIDDYARLIVIAKVLHFPLIAVRVIAKAEQDRRADEVLNRLYELRADGTTTKRWIIDFAKAVPRSNIFFPELQTLLKNIDTRGNSRRTHLRFCRTFLKNQTTFKRLLAIRTRI